MLIGTLEYLLNIRISVVLNKDILVSCEDYSGIINEIWQPNKDRKIAL